MNTQNKNSRNGPAILAYKENWPETKERFRALWAGEIIDRACISVTAIDGDYNPPAKPKTAEAKYTDIDYIRGMAQSNQGNVYFGGEAIPCTGSGLLGYTAFGGEPEFRDRTIWIHPCIANYDTPYRFDPENPWLRRCIEVVRGLIEDGCDGGKYLVGTNVIMMPLDALSALRSPENLCTDLLEYPDEVRQTMAELMRAYKWLIEVCYDDTIPPDHGWSVMEMWAPGRLSQTTCDFSALISPEHFRRFAVPEIEEIANWLDYSVHELDGADALKHVPALLDIDALSGIQWNPGDAYHAAGGSALKWVPLCRQIQNAGKVMQLWVNYDEVEAFLREVVPKYLHIRTAAPSVKAADELLKNTPRWSCKR